MAESNDENRHFSVTLPMSITDRLDEIAKEDGDSRAGVVRRAVLDWLRRLDQMRRRAS